MNNYNAAAITVQLFFLPSLLQLSLQAFPCLGIILHHRIVTTPNVSSFIFIMLQKIIFIKFCNLFKYYKYYNIVLLYCIIL